MVCFSYLLVNLTLCWLLGAGKSTLIGMLIGLFPPTKGTAYVRGHNLEDEIDDIRGFMGICPQDGNLLIPKLIFV